MLAVYSFYFHRMERKLRFYSVKNFERKRAALRPLIVSLPISSFTASSATDLEQLYARLTATRSFPPTWIDSTQNPAETVVLCSLRCHPPQFTPNVAYVVKIDGELKWTLMCYTRRIEADECGVLAGIPLKLQGVQDVVNLLTTVHRSKICTGVQDDKFANLVETHCGVFRDQSGSYIIIYSYSLYLIISSFLSGCRTVAYHESLPFPTIRHNNCEFLLSSESQTSRCCQCTKFRDSLRMKYTRQQGEKSRTEPSSHVPYSCLTPDELKARMHRVHEELRRIQKERDRLKLKLSKVCREQGVCVDDGLHQDLTSIMKNNSQKVLKAFHPNSFGHIFWVQQLEATSKDPRGMRWHPLMVRWCLYLRHQSQSAYETLRQSGCLVLPSQRTLRDYTHYIKAATGFSAEVDKQLMQAASMKTCKEWEKCMILLIDEMHIKEDLIYDKHSGALIGFANLGEINTHLLHFEHSLSQGDSASQPLAKTMLTFMVRGLFTSLRFPYAQFPCTKLTGDLLFDPFWEAIYRLERCGFKV